MASGRPVAVWQTGSTRRAASGPGMAGGSLGTRRNVVIVPKPFTSTCWAWNAWRPSSRASRRFDPVGNARRLIRAACYRGRPRGRTASAYAR
jgi:hypothetical protein